MALILFFIGSFLGIIVAAVQTMFHDASLWQAFGTYCTFSLAIPFFVGLLAYALSNLRSMEREDDASFGMNEA
ncbi:hypothetical protein BXY66_0486 [Shimia isoporae]|uniref:Uncharacterized protein n=1 Tax=Shimia isoporae TaxID=647720 RepID=A0A4R1NL82_9RHOB|nr:hypothetical protein [Shimia isoporae]TCL08449.1 hypothetical protein BXY66_0486 [Shimia isoporae]